MGLSLELDMIYTCFAFLKGYEPLTWDAGIWHDLTSDDPTWNGNPPNALEIWNGRGRESGEKLKLLQSRKWTIQLYSTSDKRRGDCCFLSHCLAVDTHTNPHAHAHAYAHTHMGSGLVCFFFVCDALSLKMGCWSQGDLDVLGSGRHPLAFRDQTCYPLATPSQLR
jgi:hypothetical protein